jgi:hypothetical protein
MSRTLLTDILEVVRNQGETGSHRSPRWADTVDVLGEAMDAAIAGVVGDRSLADLLDEHEKNEAKD